MTQGKRTVKCRTGKKSKKVDRSDGQPSWVQTVHCQVELTWILLWLIPIIKYIRVINVLTVRCLVASLRLILLTINHLWGTKEAADSTRGKEIEIEIDRYWSRSRAQCRSNGNCYCCSSSTTATATLMTMMTSSCWPTAAKAASAEVLQFISLVCHSVDDW